MDFKPRLRKVRYVDPRRGKGTRGGLRVIYFWWETGQQFYDKNEVQDLSSRERKVLKERLKRELEARDGET